MLLTSLITAPIAPFVLPAPAPSSSDAGPPPGYQTVKNTCSAPETLFCCNGTGAVGVTGEPTSTRTGCMHPYSHSPFLSSRLQEADNKLSLKGQAAMVGKSSLACHRIRLLPCYWRLARFLLRRLCKWFLTHEHLRSAVDSTLRRSLQVLRLAVAFPP